jgi:hypothetical protein
MLRAGAGKVGRDGSVPVEPSPLPWLVRITLAAAFFTCVVHADPSELWVTVRLCNVCGAWQPLLTCAVALVPLAPPPVRAVHAAACAALLLYHYRPRLEWDVRTQDLLSLRDLLSPPPTLALGFHLWFASMMRMSHNVVAELSAHSGVLSSASYAYEMLRGRGLSAVTNTEYDLRMVSARPFGPEQVTAVMNSPQVQAALHSAQLRAFLRASGQWTFAKPPATQDTALPPLPPRRRGAHTNSSSSGKATITAAAGSAVAAAIASDFDWVVAEAASERASREVAREQAEAGRHERYRQREKERYFARLEGKPDPHPHNSLADDDNGGSAGDGSGAGAAVNRSKEAEFDALLAEATAQARPNPGMVWIDRYLRKQTWEWAISRPDGAFARPTVRRTSTSDEANAVADGGEGPASFQFSFPPKRKAGEDPEWEAARQRERKAAAEAPAGAAASAAADDAKPRGELLVAGGSATAPVRWGALLRAALRGPRLTVTGGGTDLRGCFPVVDRVSGQTGLLCFEGRLVPADEDATAVPAPIRSADVVARQRSVARATEVFPSGNTDAVPPIAMIVTRKPLRTNGSNRRASAAAAAAGAATAVHADDDGDDDDDPREFMGVVGALSDRLQVDRVAFVLSGEPVRFEPTAQMTTGAVQRSNALLPERFEPTPPQLADRGIDLTDVFAGEQDRGSGGGPVTLPPFTLAGAVAAAQDERVLHPQFENRMLRDPRTGNLR